MPIKRLLLSIIKGLGWLLLGFFLYVLSIQLIQNPVHLIQLNTLWKEYSFSLLLLHLLILILIYLAWPFLIKLIVKQHQLNPDAAVLKKAKLGRIYLIGILVLLSFLSYLG